MSEAFAGAVPAQPFTADELDNFELSILACQNPNKLVADLARTTLGAIVQHHGKAKCDMMMAALDAKHNPAGTA